MAGIAMIVVSAVMLLLIATFFQSIAQDGGVGFQQAIGSLVPTFDFK